MSDESVFLSYIRMVFKQWVAFQYAIDEGMGGRYAREKEEWFGDEIEKFFKTNDNLEFEDIEYFMADILDDEFDIVVEDGSLSEISKKLCEAFKLCHSGSESEVQKLIPTVVASSSSRTHSNTMDTTESELAEVGPPLASQMNELKINVCTNDTEISDGWTEVKTRRKQK